MNANTTNIFGINGHDLHLAARRARRIVRREAAQQAQAREEAQRDRHLEIRRQRAAARRRARELAAAEGLHGVALTNRARTLYQERLELIRAYRSTSA